MLKTRFGLWDGGMCAAVLLLAGMLAVGIAARAGGENAAVVVSVDGEIALQVPLVGTNGRFPMEGAYPLTVCVQEGGVWVEEATCPGHDCQKQGRITRPGQTIVCLPGRITVAIQGESPLDVTVG